MLSALLDRGANVEAKSKEKLYSALHYAALGDSVSALRRLLATQASRDVVDAEGNTPLHLAAAKGHKQPLELLILRGANKNAANKVGATALHLAVERAQEAVSKKLLAEGVNVNAQDHNGATTAACCCRVRRERGDCPRSPSGPPHTPLAPDLHGHCPAPRENWAPVPLQTDPSASGGAASCPR